MTCFKKLNTQDAYYFLFRKLKNMNIGQFSTARLASWLQAHQELKGHQPCLRYAGGWSVRVGEVCRRPGLKFAG